MKLIHRLFTNIEFLDSIITALYIIQSHLEFNLGISAFTYKFQLYNKKFFEKLPRLFLCQSYDSGNNIFVNINSATIIPNNSIYYANGARTVVKKQTHTYLYIGHLKKYSIQLSYFSDQQMKIQVTLVSNSPCKFGIVIHNCNSIVILYATQSCIACHIQL